MPTRLGLALLVVSWSGGGQRRSSNHHRRVFGEDPWPSGRARGISGGDLGEAITMRFSAGVTGFGRTSPPTTHRTKLRDRLMPSEYNHAGPRMARRRPSRCASPVSPSHDRLQPPRRHPSAMSPSPRKATRRRRSRQRVPLPVEKVTDETCNRTLPLVDGRRRFDITLNFDRFDSFARAMGPFRAPLQCAGFTTRVAAADRQARQFHPHHTRSPDRSSR